ncbi:hypothetical protein RND81_03G080700 [Saponaria officinalis]|uniref:Pentatricopeptide repeat-containing protein n=1 Tax=Saponaria officinalis TaxID=3572 RepID=A0AAW1M5V2_SAPOF
MRTSLITYRNKVCSSLSFFYSPFHTHLHYTVFPSSFIHSASISIPPHQFSPTHFKSRGNTVFFNEKDDNFSANKLLLRVSPKYLNVSTWKPENVCGFLLDCRKSGFDAETIECLWEFFWRVDGNYEGFNHLPKSFEVLCSMLINVGMFREVELLLSVAENRGILIDSDEIYSGLIEGYVSAGDFERAVSVYDRIKRQQRLVLSLSCYRSIIDVLMKERKVERVISVYEEAVEAGFEFGDDETRNLETLIGFLCFNGKITEARKVLKKIVATGWKPSRVVLSEVANVYCEKRDFEDVLNFFSEMKCAPDIVVGNRVIHLLCTHFDIRRADLFLWKLEQLGFSPNEITFGIFIGFCCRDGRLRDAFCYLSDIFNRGLKPDRRSYNALISSIFKAGMTEHARHIYNDMIDNGIKPNMATYRALLAGYCKARQFIEVKLLVDEMTNYGLLHLSPLEDTLCKAFCVLGFDPLTVKLKRDNDLKNFRTEFFDDLGNGLYLDTNLDVFEKTISSVLEESLVPDFNLLVSRLFDDQNAKEVVLKFDEMAHWGQELSPPVFSAFIRLLTHSNLMHQILTRRFGRPETASNLLDQILKMRNVPETSSYDYDCVVQSFCNYNNLNCAMQFLTEMLDRKLKPSLDTWDLIIEKLCLQRHATDAEGLLNSMLNVGQAPTKKMYLSVIDRYRIENNLTKASELLHMMQQHGYEPDFTTQWSLISSRLNNSHDRQGSHQGFLSRLLGGSGLFAEGGPKSRRG